ncbi:MAG: transposase [Deltaproteobacteria bacterium]|nr:transposase [Deltaproteobacteria bacterium]
MLKRPTYLRGTTPETLKLNVVHVLEPNPPEDEDPIQWLLYTSLPVGNSAEVEAVVDIYRARWTIEEFNKALKTGCKYESREFQTLHALLVVLAMTFPIACELLRLRSRARATPGAPASEILTETQLEVLRIMGPYKLSPEPTASEALLAVAHQKRNGEPGWLVLYRGMSELYTLTRGFEEGRKKKVRSRNL